MADAIPVHAQPKKEPKIIAPQGSGVVNGLMTPGSDEVIPPTDFLKAGLLIEPGDRQEFDKASKAVLVDVPLQEKGPEGASKVLSHNAWRTDH